MYSAIIGSLLNFFLRIAMWLGLAKAITDRERAKHVEKVAEHNKEEAEKWANRPVGNPNTIARLRRKAARASKRIT